jgi:replicative DNA helicase
MGKSALAQGWALAAAAKGVGVGIITLEMPGEELAERALAMDGRVHSGDIRSGDLRDDASRRLYASADRLAGMPVWVDDTPAASIAQIVAKVRRLKARHPEVGLVVLDYLQLATAEGPRGQSRQQEIGRISRGMKELAKEQAVCCLSLAQLSRKCEERTDKRPMPSDLREAGDLEQDADSIIFVYRPEVYDKDTPKKGTAELIIGKNRGGPTGTVEVAWIGAEYRFAPLASGAPPSGHTWHDSEPEDRW